jgi:hypothetical protein
MKSRQLKLGAVINGMKHGCHCLDTFLIKQLLQAVANLIVFRTSKHLCAFYT